MVNLPTQLFPFQDSTRLPSVSTVIQTAYMQGFLQIVFLAIEMNMTEPMILIIEPLASRPIVRHVMGQGQTLGMMPNFLIQLSPFRDSTGWLSVPTAILTANIQEYLLIAYRAIWMITATPRIPITKPLIFRPNVKPVMEQVLSIGRPSLLTTALIGFCGVRIPHWIVQVVTIRAMICPGTVTAVMRRTTTILPIPTTAGQASPPIVNSVIIPPIFRGLRLFSIINSL
jgi:hypothetical protein